VALNPTMDIDWLRTYCLTLPGTTEQIQWGDDLIFKVAKKIYAGMPLSESAPVRLTFKSTPEAAAELIEREGFIPAPYVGKYHWVAMTDLEAAKPTEIKVLIRRSYDLVVAALPKRAQALLLLPDPHAD
jgi:predicted DNA-binding protein (MmcQ/YjbR family)